MWGGKTSANVKEKYSFAVDPSGLTEVNLKEVSSKTSSNMISGVYSRNDGSVIEYKFTASKGQESMITFEPWKYINTSPENARSYTSLVNAGMLKPVKLALCKMTDDEISTKPQKTGSADLFLGERILNAIENSKHQNKMFDIAKLIPECEFIRYSNNLRASKSCMIEKTSPDRYDEKLGFLDSNGLLIEETSRSGKAIAISFDQRRLDLKGGLDIFGMTPGIEIKKKECPGLEERDPLDFGFRGEIKEIQKNGETLFTIHEFTGGGSGGNGRKTTISFEDKTCEGIYTAVRSLDGAGDLIFKEYKGHL